MLFQPRISSLLFYIVALLSLSSASESRVSSGAHDILVRHGLPKGLLPDSVISYSLSTDGSFEIELQKPCYVHFTDLVYYDKKITGKLDYGAITELAGIQAKKLFVWVPVTAINIDPSDNQIEFHVGFLSEKLPAQQFQEIPTCKSNGCAEHLPGEGFITEV
ncbi:uncharacterized protein [Aristolochia californica]|uniref:uncharacterized protein n=1 Tax=Aristolochia californica TaxID=171875 RepID=UPI0035E1320E